MRIKGLIGLMIIAVLLGVSGIAHASTIDFESTATGIYSSLDFGDAVLTSNSGTFKIQYFSGWGGNYLYDNDISGSKLTFSTAVYTVSLYVGDFGLDADTVYLYAYDASGNLLASDSDALPKTTSSILTATTLSVTSSTAIAYIIFYSTGINTATAGSVMWDNITYSGSNSASVPEPATMLLLGFGLMGLAGLRKKLKK